MRAAALAVLAAALAACQPSEAPEAAPPDAAPAVADIDGRGTEPFWAVQVRGDRIELQRPDSPTLTATGATAREGQRTRWRAQTIAVTARPQPGCSDGMSDLTYPLAVEVEVQGQTLKGCGAPAGEVPKGER